MPKASTAVAPRILKRVEPWTPERTARNVITIRVPGVGRGWQQWFLLRSDVHHDNPKCDQKLERKHLDQAKERNAVIIDNGDLFCAMQGKYDKRSSKDAIRPEHQGGDYLDRLVDTSFDFYEPYRKQLVVLGRGNHETAIRKSHETDLTDRLAFRLRDNGKSETTFASGYGGWVRLMLVRAGGTRRESIKLHHYHGSGGGGPVTRGVIQTNRMAVYTPDADVILTGHTHDEWIVPVPRQRISDGGVCFRDEVYHVRVPGYKDAWGDGDSGWEVETAKGPKPKGSAWMRLFLEEDEIKTEITFAK